MRHDWRFLLPHADDGIFDHLLLIGGSSELDASVADLGLARCVSRSVRNGDPADLVVVLADADVSFDSLAPHIADRAVVYVEVDRRQPGRRMLTPRRVTRRLAAHGLDTIAAYWVKPGFPRRDMYLPLGHRGASPAPCFSIVASRGTGCRLPALLEQMCAGQEQMADPVLLATGEMDCDRLVILLFERDADRPMAVLKLPRTARFNDAVEHEHAVLRDVSAMLPPPLLSSIPASTLVRLGDVSVTAETAVLGTSMASRPRRGAAGALDDLRCAAAWLTTFHRETTRGHAEAVDWVADELAGRMCREYAALFGVTPCERYLFGAALDGVDAGAGELPIVWQHGDFGPWNIYREGAHVSVIDWKSARRGPALADLLYFVLHWSAAVRGCETREQRICHFESLFCVPMAKDAIGRAIDAQLFEYMHAVGVAPALMPQVLLYTVLEHAVRRARLLARTGRAPSRDIEVNEYLGYVDVLARHQDRLFRQTCAQGVIYATG